MEREVGGQIRMGNTCNSMADSCQCMTKPTEMLWSNYPPTYKKENKKLQRCNSNGAWCHYLSPFVVVILLLVFSLKLALSHSSFTFIKRLFSSSSLSAIRVVSPAYLRLLIFLPPILIPACNSSSTVFLIMCSGYRLNKQGGGRQLCHVPFFILNQSLAPYRVLIVVFWPAYKLLRRQ